MAKFEEPFEDTKELFNSLITLADLNQSINIEVLVNNRQKEIYKLFKTNDLTRYKTNVDVFLVINEMVFDQLSDEQKVIVADESLAGIHYDSEKEKLTLTKPDVSTYSGLLKKYGEKQYLELNELIKLIYSQERNTEEANA
jgi:hypothetical protein